MVWGLVRSFGLERRKAPRTTAVVGVAALLVVAGASAAVAMRAANTPPLSPAGLAGAAHHRRRLRAVPRHDASGPLLTPLSAAPERRQDWREASGLATGERAQRDSNP